MFNISDHDAGGPGLEVVDLEHRGIMPARIGLRVETHLGAQGSVVAACRRGRATFWRSGLTAAVFDSVRSWIDKRSTLPEHSSPRLASRLRTPLPLSGGELEARDGPARLQRQHQAGGPRIDFLIAASADTQGWSKLNGDTIALHKCKSNWRLEQVDLLPLGDMYAVCPLGQAALWN